MKIKFNHSFFRGVSQSKAIVYLLCNALIVVLGFALLVYPAPSSIMPSNGLESDTTAVEPNMTSYALRTAIGTGMVATGICGFITFGWVIYEDNEQRRKKGVNEAAEKIGLVNVFDKRSIAISDEYARRVESAKEHIDIMGFGLSALLTDYGDHFAEWASHASVRILLIDPDYPCTGYALADQRDREEQNEVGSIRKEALEFLRRTEAIRMDSNIDFQIRLTTVLPSVNIFRIDNELFWGPYLVKSNQRIERLLSRNLPTFIVDNHGFLFDVLVEHFDAIWDDADKSHAPMGDDF